MGWYILIFLNYLSLKLFGNLWGNSYIKFAILDMIISNQRTNSFARVKWWSKLYIFPPNWLFLCDHYLISGQGKKVFKNVILNIYFSVFEYFYFIHYVLFDPIYSILMPCLCVAYRNLRTVTCFPVYSLPSNLASEEGIW